MTTYSRIVDGQAVDTMTGDPAEFFHEEVAAQFVIVPNGTGNGDRVDAAGKWTKAPIAAPFEPAAPPMPSLSPMQFYMAFTPAERINIQKSQDPVVAEFWKTFQLAVDLNHPVDPNLKSVSDGLAYLAAQNLLSGADRIPQIQAGIAQ